MKKIIIIISIFLLTGCTTALSSNLTIENSILHVLQTGEKTQNTFNKGYKYYKPRDFTVIEDNELNQVLLNNGYKFYLSIDLNAYHEKTSPTTIRENIYLNYNFNYNNINGYLQLRQTKNGYFYVRMLYNYSCIEVRVKESDLKKAVIDSSIILSSIKYNDKVIEKLITTRDLNDSESAFQIATPENKEDKKNILDVMEHDQYTE